MKRRLSIAAVALLIPLPALAEVQGQGAQSWSNSWLVQVGNGAGAYGSGNPLATVDPANASFAASATLTPSGTAGTAGTIGSAAASLSNTGRSFGWNCTSSGLGTVTLVDGSIRAVWMYANNGADVRGDAFAIIDAEPPSGVPCKFQVYR